MNSCFLLVGKNVGEKAEIQEGDFRNGSSGSQSRGKYKESLPIIPCTKVTLALVNYIVWMADHGFPLTRTIIKCLALEVIKDSSRKTLVYLEKGQ